MENIKVYEVLTGYGYNNYSWGLYFDLNEAKKQAMELAEFFAKEYCEEPFKLISGQSSCTYHVSIHPSSEKDLKELRRRNLRYLKVEERIVN